MTTDNKTVQAVIDSYLETALWVYPADEGEGETDAIEPMSIASQGRVVGALWNIYCRLGWVEDTTDKAVAFGRDLFFSRTGQGTGLWDDYKGALWNDHGEDMHADVAGFGELLVYRNDEGELVIEEDDWTNTMVSIHYIEERLMKERI